MISGLSAWQRERWWEARSGRTGDFGEKHSSFQANGFAGWQLSGKNGRPARAGGRCTWADFAGTPASVGSRGNNTQGNPHPTTARASQHCLLSKFFPFEALVAGGLCSLHPVHCFNLLTRGFSWLQCFMFTQVHFFFAFQGTSLKNKD